MLVNVHYVEEILRMVGDALHPKWCRLFWRPFLINYNFLNFFDSSFPIFFRSVFELSNLSFDYYSLLDPNHLFLLNRPTRFKPSWSRFEVLSLLLLGEILLVD